MRSSLPLPLLLLLTLATPSISAPIPLRLEDCLRYESCRFALPSIFSQQESERLAGDTIPLKDPHFSGHQLRPINQDHAGDIRLLEYPRQQHAEAERPDLQSLNPKPESVLRAAIGDKLSGGTQASRWTNGPIIAEGKTISIIEASHIEVTGKTDARRYGLAGLSESVWKKVGFIASKSLRRCRIHRPTIIHKDSVGRDGWIITYSYGYRYVPTGYTDMLVVGIVMLFVAAMLLVEGLDRAIGLTRSILGWDQGQIRLEDNNCLRADPSSPYCFNKYHFIPEPPRNNSKSASGSGESMEEKTTRI